MYSQSMQMSGRCINSITPLILLIDAKHTVNVFFIENLSRIGPDS